MNIVPTPSGMTVTYLFGGVPSQETRYALGEVIDQREQNSPGVWHVVSAIEDGAVVATITLRIGDKVIRVEEERWRLAGDRLTKESTITATWPTAAPPVRQPTTVGTYMRVK